MLNCVPGAITLFARCRNWPKPVAAPSASVMRWTLIVPDGWLFKACCAAALKRTAKFPVAAATVARTRNPPARKMPNLPFMTRAPLERSTAVDDVAILIHVKRTSFNDGNAGAGSHVREFQSGSYRNYVAACG